MSFKIGEPVTDETDKNILLAEKRLLNLEEVVDKNKVPTEKRRLKLKLTTRKWAITRAKRMIKAEKELKYFDNSFKILVEILDKEVQGKARE